VTPDRPVSVDEADALVQERWYGLGDDDARRILDAISGLTDAELLDRPHLLTGAVIANDLLRAESTATGGDRSTLLERYSVVAENAEHRNDTRWLMIRMIAARWRGDLDQALALSDRLSRRGVTGGVRAALLDDGDEVSRPGQIALQRGLTAALAGDASTAMALFADAHRSSGPPPFRHFAGSNAAANAAMLAAIEGHDTVAQKWLDRVGDPGELPTWCRDLVTLGATVASAVLAIDTLDFAEASPLRDRLESAGDRYELWPFQLYALTEYDLARGEPVQAFKRLKQVGFERHLTIATDTIADHLVFRAYLDTLIAGGEGGLVLRLAEDLGTPLRALVPIARTRLIAGDSLGAARVAARAMRRVLIPKRDMWEAAVVHAIARLRDRDTEGALRSFGIVLSGNPRSLPSILARQPARDVEDLYHLACLQPPLRQRGMESITADLVVLTAREQRILQHLADGRTAAQIAVKDVTSEHTVRTHIKRIYRKLRVSSRDEALARANQHGLVRWHHQDGRRDAHI
jgi:LuxR family transcriptional regulator, maltose regulon positive regulatory protein